jgi:hypothetical protein
MIWVDGKITKRKNEQRDTKIKKPKVFRKQKARSLWTIYLLLQIVTLSKVISPEMNLTTDAPWRAIKLS